jgi:oxalate decarboxylase/phosphoglucose isomerase-like protein (cupin superfamily)
MKLGTQKTLEQLKPVLKDPNTTGPDPVYFVFYEVSTDKWANITMIQNGKIGEECPKTFGHYHSIGAPKETYHLLEGQGVLQMAKKHFAGDKWIPEMVDEVYLIKAKPGDEIVINENFAHSWSNVGNMPTISYDDWRSGHQPSDYADVERLQGLPYYLVEENGQIKAIPNQNYKDLPEPIWLTAEEFSKLTTNY